jgi:hypothetical protein
MICGRDQWCKPDGFPKIRRTWIISIILGSLLYGVSFGSEEKAASLSPIDLLPKIHDLKGWKSADPPDVYMGEELFDYMDGGAELYLEFNFKQVAIQEYIYNKSSSLMIEIYQMDSPKNAYGIYSFDTRGEHPIIGQGATYSSGLLKFWKGPFFCRILSLDRGEKMRSLIFVIGEKIAAKIPTEGTKSQLLTYVPRENIIPESIHYFHQRVTLNNFYYLSDKNILNLNEATEGVFFEYQHQEKPVKVILIGYPRIKDSLAAFQDFINSYLQDKDFKNLGSIEEKEIIRPMGNGEYMGIKLARDYLVLIFETRNKQICRELFGVIDKRLGVTMKNRP